MSVRTDLEELYEAFYPHLVVALRAVTHDRDAAEDAAQEAFARLLRTHSLDRLARPEAWLYTVGVNVLRSHSRAVQRSHRKWTFRHDPSRTVASDPALSVESVDLQRALGELPRIYRDVLVLFYLLDQPIARIAEHDRVSVGTIKSRLSRGRELLALHLREVDTT